MTVFTAVDVIAHSADPNDPRSIDARRVDALVDLRRRTHPRVDGPGGRV
ncbi:MAG TPA: hypothetical protein VJ644_03695 [Jiangellaceae bacterium]|nr:hypothetical protein [Jiangellaceae bacterium]